MSVDILRCIYTQYLIREWTPVMVSRVAPYRPAFWKMEKYCPGLKVPVSYFYIPGMGIIVSDAVNANELVLELYSFHTPDKFRTSIS